MTSTNDSIAPPLYLQKSVTISYECIVELLLLFADPIPIPARTSYLAVHNNPTHPRSLQEFNEGGELRVRRLRRALLLHLLRRRTKTTTSRCFLPSPFRFLCRIQWGESRDFDSNFVHTICGRDALIFLRLPLSCKACRIL